MLDTYQQYTSRRCIDSHYFQRNIDSNNRCHDNRRVHRLPDSSHPVVHIAGYRHSRNIQPTHDNHIDPHHHHQLAQQNIPFPKNGYIDCGRHTRNSLLKDGSHMHLHRRRVDCHDNHSTVHKSGRRDSTSSPPKHGSRIDQRHHHLENPD